MQLFWGGGISNSQVITEEGKHSLDAVQNNPNVEGSLRQVLNDVSTKVESNKITWDNQLIDGTADANNYYNNGIYQVSSSQNLKNFAITNGFLLVFSPTPGCAIQFNTNFAGEILYFRARWFGTWRQWNHIVFA